MNRTRVRRTQPPPAVELDPGACLCPRGPVTVATWRDGDLVDVQRRHLLAHRCGLPIEHLDPRTYQAAIRPRR
jgi:hypothetical protein